MRSGSTSMRSPMPGQQFRGRPVAVRAEAQLEHLARGVLADQRGRRALGHDPALVDHDQPIAELLGLIHVVGGEHQRRALLLQAEQPVPEDVARLRVEAGGRLVEQQDAGVVHERARDREAALHAAGQVVDLGLRALGQLGELEQLVGALADVGARQAEVAPVDEQVLADLELHVEVVGLRHDAELGADLGAVLVRVQVQDGQVAAGARRDRAHHPHRGRLAGAVGPEQPERLTGRDLEVDAVDGGDLFVGLGEGGRRDHRCSHGRPPYDAPRTGRNRHCPRIRRVARAVNLS